MSPEKPTMGLVSPFLESSLPGFSHQKERLPFPSHRRVRSHIFSRWVQDLVVGTPASQQFLGCRGFGVTTRRGSGRWTLVELSWTSVSVSSLSELSESESLPIHSSIASIFSESIQTTARQKGLLSGVLHIVRLKTSTLQVALRVLVRVVDR
jgi:hypothetical protein